MDSGRISFGPRLIHSTGFGTDQKQKIGILRVFSNSKATLRVDHGSANRLRTLLIGYLLIQCRLRLSEIVLVTIWSRFGHHLVTILDVAKFIDNLQWVD